MKLICEFWRFASRDNYELGFFVALMAITAGGAIRGWLGVVGAAVVCVLGQVVRKRVENARAAG